MGSADPDPSRLELVRKAKELIEQAESEQSLPSQIAETARDYLDHYKNHLDQQGGSVSPNLQAESIAAGATYTAARLSIAKIGQEEAGEMFGVNANTVAYHYPKILDSINNSLAA